MSSDSKANTATFCKAICEEKMGQESERMMALLPGPDPAFCHLIVMYNRKLGGRKAANEARATDVQGVEECRTVEGG